ncbi:MAG: hypothetical protein AAF573_09655 [Bacteroidota bacterium]
MVKKILHSFTSQHFKNKDKWHVVFFLLLILAVSWWFHYFEIFHYAPYATHSWRQSDSVSFVQNYYNNGLDFFDLRVHHTISGEGYGAPSEFPILYYLTAGIWKVFTPHDGVLRMIDFILLLLGLFSISRLTFHLTNDIFYALFPPFLLMGSPVIAFFGFNYIPNPPALGLCLTGMLCFYYFYKNQKRKWLIISWLLFTLAGLLKVTVLIPFLALLGVFLLEKLNLIQFRSDRKIFKKGWWNLLYWISSFVIIGSWIVWVRNYNELHQCGIFMTKARPIWTLVEPAITETWHWVIREGAPQYFHPFTRYTIFGMLFVLLFLWRKKQPEIIYFLNLLIFLGALGCFLIFYRQFFVHDYYAIELMTFPAAVSVTFLYVFKNHFPKISNHLLSKMLLAVFLFINLHYAKESIEERYAGGVIFNREYNVTTYKKQQVQAYLKSLGIEHPEKVITMPDVSPNFNLNYFNLRGWSEFAMNPQPFEPWVFRAFMDNGANYLIVTEEEYLTHQNLESFIKHPLGNFENSIFVFDLRRLPREPKD